MPPPQEPEALRRRLRALCVDDDPLLRELVRELLEQDGHLVTLASGGAEALHAFEDARAAAAAFDVVLTDLGMPEVDGVDVARGVKATSPGAKVIMLTGWGGDADRQPRKLAGVDRVLRKPPRLRELRQALHELFPEA